MNGVLILMIIIVVTVGVYAVAPSVLGHTSDEINIKLPNGTIETLQQSFSQDLVVRDSTRNISVNDIYLQSTGTYASAYLKNIQQRTQSPFDLVSWEVSTPDADCSCALVSREKPRCSFCVAAVSGDMNVLANTIVSTFPGAMENIQTTQSTTFIFADGSSFTLTGTDLEMGQFNQGLVEQGYFFGDPVYVSSATAAAMVQTAQNLATVLAEGGFYSGGGGPPATVDADAQAQIDAAVQAVADALASVQGGGATPTPAVSTITVADVGPPGGSTDESNAAVTLEAGGGGASGGGGTEGW